MNEPQNLTLVRQGYDAFGRGDIPTLLTLFDENISWVTRGPADLPTAGSRTGLRGAQQFFQALSALVEILRFEPAEFIAQGDRVIVIGDETCRVRASGTELDFRWVHVFTVRAGKVVSFEEFGDPTLLVADVRAARATTA